jgi:hypothetical protein
VVQCKKPGILCGSMQNLCGSMQNNPSFYVVQCKTLAETPWGATVSAPLTNS